MESTRAYYMSHILLKNKIFFDWKIFKDNLDKGPMAMKQYLLDLWNSIDQKCFKEGTKIKDLDRVITVDDFNILATKKDQKIIFFFSLPEPDSFDVQAKAIALILENGKMPRYITMEIWAEKEIAKQYTIGEWILKDNKFEHLNIGKIDGKTTKDFMSYIIDNII